MVILAIPVPEFPVIPVIQDIAASPVIPATVVIAAQLKAVLSY